MEFGEGENIYEDEEGQLSPKKGIYISRNQDIIWKTFMRVRIEEGKLQL